MPELVLSKVIGGDFFMGQREYVPGTYDIPVLEPVLRRQFFIYVL